MRTSDEHEAGDEAGLQAPAELVKALKELPQTRPFVPTYVDEAILQAAQRHLARAEKSWRTRFPILQWLAAGAAVVTIALVAYHFFTPGAWLTVGRNDKKADVARSIEESVVPAPAAGLAYVKRGDILDALILAKRLQSGPVRDERWDANGDGVVDERDVQAIAAQVVRLDKGGRS